MLSDAKLPKNFWAEALSTANYIINRTPTASLDFLTPYEILNGKIPNIGHLKVFGCVCYMHIDKELRNKLDFKSRKCIFLGYSATMKAYRLYDCNENRIVNSRNVLFDETKNYLSVNPDPKVKNANIDTSVGQSEVYDNGDTPSDTSVGQSEVYGNDVTQSIISDGGSENFDISNSHHSETSLSDPNDEIPLGVRRSSRTSKPPDKFGEWVNISVGNFEPKTVQEALDSPESVQWKQAMENEILAMKKNEVWSLMKLPQDVKIIDNKWVFKRKVDSKGEVKFKARLVAKGFTQEYGIDYFDISSPVARFESVRTTLAFGAKIGMEFHHMDVDSAFLNGVLTEKIYMKQPEGFVSENNPNSVCYLKKAIYGLKQASKCWNDTFHEYLMKIGFKPSLTDPCLYSYMKNDQICFIILYVDDLLIGCSSKSFINEIKAQLCEEFSMKDLGVASEFLGIQINQTEKGIFIHQTKFSESFLKRVNFENCKPIKTPAEVGLKLHLTQDNEDPFDKEVYQSAIGVLLFICTRTRPDLAFAVCNAARYTSNPSKLHWNALKRIFRYLKGTSHYGIFYESKASNKLIGYADADWAGNISDRKSTSGFCFYVGKGIVSWRSSKQSCVALSTAEAELISLSSAAQEAVWLGKLLKDLGNMDDEAIKIFEDNNSTISLVKSFKNHAKLKHVDIKYKFTSELIKDGKIQVFYCPSDENCSDIFTKPLSIDKFRKFRDLLGVVSFE